MFQSSAALTVWQGRDCPEGFILMSSHDCEVWARKLQAWDLNTSNSTVEVGS